jgi:hypothetical protein
LSDNRSDHQHDYDAIEYVVTVRRRNIWQRLGCLLGIIGWLAFISIPFFFIVLAVRGQITIPRGGDIPNRDTYPHLQVRLVMEIDFRGLNITSTMVDRQDSNTLCVQTDVRFVLWEGEGEAATYCECYARSQADPAWDLTNAVEGACQ